ncbi:MAG: transcriptional regulator NrdR [Candidatus Hydrogenedentes bacterium]|nr:transcriptional regulator NrdR [Candidatus Hydrogenedentota bacterium]
MKCPFCNYGKSKVVDSRVSLEGNVIRRRRECLKCTRRYTTYERVEEVSPMVIKKDGRRENFQRWKLRQGLMKAIHKRPISLEQIESLIDDVEKTLFNAGRQEVTSREIGEAVIDRLKKLDEVAYVRFASVYRQFRDINEFMEELKGMLSTGGETSPHKKS